MHQRWMKGGPAGAVYGTSESGWMEVNNILSWFQKLFLSAVSHLTTTVPVLLLVDGRNVPISTDLI